MYTSIKKKIIQFQDIIVDFYKKNLVKIIILISVFILLEQARTFPYINLIPNIHFLIIGFIVFLALLFFQQSIPNRSVVWIGVGFLLVAVISTIFEQTEFADLIGFLVFVLLSLTVLRQIVSDRHVLKKDLD